MEGRGAGKVPRGSILMTVDWQRLALTAVFVGCLFGGVAHKPLLVAARLMADACVACAG